MKISQLLVSTLAWLVVTFSTAASASAAPEEFPVLAFQRTSESGLQIDAELSKNVFNTYTHQETHEVLVPYVVTVAYEVVETYYVWVKVCHNENHPVNVCHKEKVCVRYPTYHCYYEKICHVENHVKPVCHKEREARTRVVTKYRKETHYRTEYQTVWVTDTVFDHQWSVGASVLFPENAPLADGDSENVTFRLRGTEQEPDVGLEIQSARYAYTLASKTFDGKWFAMTLEKIDQALFGDSSLTDAAVFTLGEDNIDSILEFADSAPEPEGWTTVYQVRVTGQKKKLFGGTKPIVIGEGRFNRDPEAEYQELTLSKLPGATASLLRKYLDAGDPVKVEITALRTNPNLVSNQPKSELVQDLEVRADSERRRPTRRSQSSLK